MKRVHLPLLWLFFSTYPLEGASSHKVKHLYNSLDPKSVSKHLALYQLYPNTPYGMKALSDAWALLSPESNKTANSSRPLPRVPPATEAIIALVNKQPGEETLLLSDDDLWAMEELAAWLPNRKLKGHYATTTKEVTELPPEEIDLARGLFLSQMGEDEAALRRVRSYEAMIDLMALQLIARLPKKATPQQKIREINGFIFSEMGFRFPPQSLYAKDVDLYTFLPSVLDSRRGVCLGVSILYLCLAQRLDLELEMITPPGHIYVRYREGDEIINIETTARGVDTDSELYLSVATRSLQERDIKEVIGMAHVNEASVYWQREEYQKAMECYKKAELYLPHDMLLKELMGYLYLILGEEAQAKALIAEAVEHLPDHAVAKDPLDEDILKGAATAEGVKALFMHVDEKRSSILKKKEALENEVKSHPDFRTGYFALATTWLQLHRTKEALATLEIYHTLHPDDPTAEYYLSIINMERLNYNNAWKHYNKALQLTKARDHNPKALKELQKALIRCCPE